MTDISIRKALKTSPRNKKRVIRDEKRSRHASKKRALSKAAFKDLIKESERVGTLRPRKKAHPREVS